ncbi:hypothetical protein ACQZ19_07050 [Rahnella variigena]|jgi:hypothetical protein|uniref:hypothetical protein n=1 Tax=Rahnella TaxID=34037 RepID=UPI0010A5756D|nr:MULTISPECIES: hypothetical protein [Rahnella]MBU9808840.1 hypothetical protein [Rahnella perminowiae]QUT15222.1 hypothetical protein I2123_21705 [Rahnella inusitata]THD44240.1 hypothetical protein ERD95_19135 [Enterobacteriaceae bacterium ML5]
MRDIYHAVVGSSDLLKNLSQEALTDYKNNCGDAASGIVFALTTLGCLSMEACDSDEYSDEECRRDMMGLSSALKHLPRLMQALDQNRENADYELKRRGATK